MENELKTYKTLFGLLGKHIAYSFSRGYFSDKFKKLNRDDHFYTNFDIPSIEKFPQLISEYSNLKGMNVTIPYKEAVIPYLDNLHKKAKKIGAVNTIKIKKDGSLKGYNTDCYGFKKSIKPYLEKHHTKALILGTGGASKAIAFVFEELGIDYQYVSRKPKNTQTISYQDLSEKIMKSHPVIVNCTPLGTFPKIDDCPDIPYKYVSKDFLLFDLIYNPSETTFLKLGRLQGAQIVNGYKMLEYQAEKAWKIWNS
ncbi:shikimate dehydrogenase family protein [Kordia zhangzhouensis]|uniref:shikimate dehydrogenase family protein n=1 Tax=Kordia zhangzhouensis TaxID=1620405 RepID=UPI0006295B21|nr:shikimate dehydrogenase [Kordia zhangzhouensis]